MGRSRPLRALQAPASVVVPNLYEIAGELTPCVIHVAALIVRALRRDGRPAGHVNVMGRDFARSRTALPWAAPRRR